MNRIYIFILTILTSLSLYCQQGKYYLTNYSPDNEQLTNDNFSIVQDAKQQMLFANSKGVLKFDGRFWQLINTPSTALSISNYVNEEESFVGCIDDIGFIDIKRNGMEAYRSIASFKSKPAYFSKIATNADYVYFLGQGILIQYKKKYGKITATWESSSGYDFTQLFTIGEIVFAFDPQKGFYRFEDGKLFRLKTDISPLNDLAFISKADKNKAILGTLGGQLFFFNGVYLTQIRVDDSLYIKGSVPFDAVLLNDKLLAVATSKGGVVLLDPTNGKNISIVNFYSGLPDDEVYALGKDNQSGLWMAHEYGFSRLDYFLPFKNFSVYPGLEGNITSSLTYQSKLYVGTNEGLFYLDKITNPVEFEKVLKKRSKLNKKDLEEAENSQTEELGNNSKKSNLISTIRNIFSARKKAVPQTDTLAKPATSEPKTKGFLGLFKKRRKEEPVLIQPNNNPDKKTETKDEKPKQASTKQANRNSTPKPVKVESKPKETLELQTVNYAFQKVLGLDGKVRHLMLFNGKLIVVTNKGLYEFSGTTAKKICDKPISYLYISKDKQLMYAATDYKAVMGFKIEATGYTQIFEQTGFLEKITGISEDKLNNVWISFDNFLIKYTRKDLSKADTILLENPYSEKINLIMKNDRMYFLLNSKAYYYNESKKTIISDTNFIKENGGYLKIIHSETNNVWFQASNEWHLISEDLKSNPNFIYMSLIKDISQIYVDDNKKDLWITTKSNNLYQFDISSKAEVKFAQNIFLRSLSDKQGNPLDIRQIELNEQSGNVSFTFVNPEYIDNKSLQYQYKLVGSQSEEWSEWSNDNKINFNALSSGSYELKVRTRNSLNQIRESTPLSFRVRPPYWKEWWFYLSEFLFFGTLLFLSIWLNNVTHSKNEWISKGLTFLTIVMMIEFINTVFESYFKLSDSPVISFLVQVFLAILILPFERVLSKFITHDSKITFAAVTGARKNKKDKTEDSREEGSSLEETN